MLTIYFWSNFWNKFHVPLTRQDTQKTKVRKKIAYTVSAPPHDMLFGPNSRNSHPQFLVNSISQVHVCVCSSRRLSSNSRKDILIDDINLFVFHEAHANHGNGSFPR